MLEKETKQIWKLSRNYIQFSDFKMFVVGRLLAVSHDSYCENEDK